MRPCADAEAHQALQERRLAHAVAAHEASDFAGFDFQADVAQDQRFPIGDGQIVDG